MRYRARRLRNRGLAVSSCLGAALISLALLTILAPPAFAVETHPFTGVSIGPEGKSAPGAFLYLRAVEVDRSSGDVYVLAATRDGNQSALYKFSSAGEPLDFTATGTNFIDGLSLSGRFSTEIAIAPPGSVGGTAGDIYVATGNQVAIFSPSGEKIGAIQTKAEEEGGGFGQYCGVATDSTGSVYVKTNAQSEAVITKLTPTANPVTKADNTGESIPISHTCRVAVDGNKRIYTAGLGDLGSATGAIRLQSLGAESIEVLDPEADTVAVEPGTDDFYAGRDTEIRQYASDGSLVSAFGEGMLSKVEGIAVAGPGGDVYVADNAGPVNDETSRIDVFGPLAILPKAAATLPTVITKTSAVLHGTINADGGPPAECKFEYTTGAAFERRNEEQRLTVSAGGGTFTLSFVGPGGGPAQTTAPIAFNAKAETVEKALAALPNVGSIENIDVTGGPGDKTGSSPYKISFHGTLAAQDLEQISVDPIELTETEGPGAQVRTVTDGHLGGFVGASSVPCAPAGPFSGESTEAVSAEISGLEPGTQYFYRLVGSNENGSLASNENGSAPGKTPSFETVTAFAVRSGAATNPTTTSATLNGTINPEGVSISECFFEYGLTTIYGKVIPCEAPSAGEIGGGNTPVAVHADISGLTASTAYHFRFVAGSNEFGGIVVRGTDVEFGTLGPPQILLEKFSKVGQSTAVISGAIDPHGSTTTYLVEYVSQAAFEESGYASANKVPTGGVGIGAGYDGVEVSQTLTGLEPGTVYHFRLSASNDIEPVTGPDRTFRTQVNNPLLDPCPANEAFRVESSAFLPDCRAYEQASSPEKNGDSVAGLYPLLFASEDGSAVTFYSPAGALPPAERGGTQTYSTYLARRDGSVGSWSSQRLLPPEEFGERSEFLGSTPDLRFAAVEVGSVAETGLFLIDTENGSVTQIAPYQPKGEGINQFAFDGASADGSRIFFETTARIPTTPAIPAPATGKDNLYMWDRSTGNVSLVGVLPVAEGGEAPPAGSFGGAYEWYGEEDTSRGGAFNQRDVPEPLAVGGLHAIAPSGEQIFFTAAVTGQLYLRRGLGGPEPTTAYVSTPNRGVGGTPGKRPAAFQEATPDGSKAFFLSRQKLTIDATTGPTEEGSDLYRWDASAPAGKALTDIAPDTTDPNGAEVQGLLGVSSSGDSGYFIARGQLAEGAEIGGENLYRFAEEPDGSYHISIVAILAKGEESSPDRRNVSPKVNYNADIGKTSRLSENGETLLFSSTRSLTGYANQNVEGISCNGGPCPELYLYSAATEEVTCVSCDPTGETPLGAASLQSQFFNAYFTPNEPPAVSFSRNLSADGARVFFQTPDPLVAADTNGDAGCPASAGRKGEYGGTGRCQDVYEWEAAGSGSCKTVEANGGCLYLLSTGQSEKPSNFVAASKDGSSAFIATSSQLVPSDRDQVADIYDARVDGGLSSQQSVPAEPCRSSEACKSAGSAPASGGSPGSLNFEGPGNPKSKQCKKGFIRKHGKCVSRARHHHHKKRSHHKRHKRATGKKRSGGTK